MIEHELNEQCLLQEVAGRLISGGVLAASRNLSGGVSAVTTYMEIVAPGGAVARFVMRRHGEADRRRNPHVARHEYELLKLLYRQGMRVAKPVLVDESGELFPEPYIIVEFVNGETLFDPTDPIYCAQLLADQLVDIHQIMCSQGSVPYLCDLYERAAGNLRRRPKQLDDSLSEGLIRTVLEPVWPKLPRNMETILHGDF